MFRFFKGRKLASNQPLNSIHGMSPTIKDQQETLERLKQLAAERQASVHQTPDVHDFSQKLLQQNQDLLNRR